jgi:hypothetical protein
MFMAERSVYRMLGFLPRVEPSLSIENGSQSRCHETFPHLPEMREESWLDYSNGSVISFVHR